MCGRLARPQAVRAIREPVAVQAPLSVHRRAPRRAVRVTDHPSAVRSLVHHCTSCSAGTSGADIRVSRRVKRCATFGSLHRVNAEPERRARRWAGRRATVACPPRPMGRRASCVRARCARIRVRMRCARRSACTLRSPTSCPCAHAARPAKRAAGHPGGGVIAGAAGREGTGWDSDSELTRFLPTGGSENHDVWRVVTHDVEGVEGM